jgi:hypothetical protein
LKLTKPDSKCPRCNYPFDSKCAKYHYTIDGIGCKWDVKECKFCGHKERTKIKLQIEKPKPPEGVEDESSEQGGNDKRTFI